MDFSHITVGKLGEIQLSFAKVAFGKAATVEKNLFETAIVPYGITQIAAENSGVLQKGVAQKTAHQLAAFESNPLGGEVLKMTAGKVTVF